MTLSTILNDLPESARQAWSQKAIREGRPIADLIRDAAIEAAERISTAKQPEPETAEA